MNSNEIDIEDKEVKRPLTYTIANDLTMIERVDNLIYRYEVWGEFSLKESLELMSETTSMLLDFDPSMFQVKDEQ